MTSTASPITIRRAAPEDARAIDRLAALDSRRTPAGPHLVALSGDRFVAAASLTDGQWVADPFQASESVVALLRQRVATLSGIELATPRRSFAMLPLLRGLFPAGPRARPAAHH
jgi:hypothetical protein